MPRAMIEKEGQILLVALTIRRNIRLDERVKFLRQRSHSEMKLRRLTQMGDQAELLQRRGQCLSGEGGV